MPDLKKRYSQWMQGRYGGNDKLNLFLLGAFLVLIVIAALLQLRILDIPALFGSHLRILPHSLQKHWGTSCWKSEVRAWPGKSFWHISKSGEKERAEKSIEFFRVLSAVKSCAFQKVTARWASPVQNATKNLWNGVKSQQCTGIYAF